MIKAKRCYGINAINGRSEMTFPFLLQDIGTYKTLRSLRIADLIDTVYFVGDYFLPTKNSESAIYWQEIDVIFYNRLSR